MRRPTQTPPIGGKTYPIKWEPYQQRARATGLPKGLSLVYSGRWHMTFERGGITITTPHPAPIRVETVVRRFYKVLEEAKIDLQAAGFWNDDLV